MPRTGTLWSVFYAFYFRTLNSFSLYDGVSFLSNEQMKEGGDPKTH